MLLIRLLVPVFFLAPGLAPATPPPELSCMTKYYGVIAELSDGGWSARVGDVRIPYDDKKTKTAEEKLEHPDVRDVFAPRYRTGPIKPVTAPDDDPGRTRLDALFRSFYPVKELVRVDFAGHKVQVHKKAQAAFERVSARVAKLVAADKSLAPFVARLGGTFNARNIAGTDRPSAHSYGIAIDLNDSLSDYWRWTQNGWKNRIPQAIVDAFEAEGFIWGGRWFHFDTMHFEYRPELLDGSCYPPAP
jgi:D-alanyl-D-alanine carboxypeptidase